MTDNFVREYTIIIPPASAKTHSYTDTKTEAQRLLTILTNLIIRFREQGQIRPTDLAMQWYEIPLPSGTSEYRVSLFSTSEAVIPEIVTAVRDLAIEQGFTVLLRTADIQEVLYSGDQKAAAYFVDTYMPNNVASPGAMTAGANFTAAGAKNAYAKQTCKPLVSNIPDEREVDLSASATKVTVLRDLGVKNALYRLKSAIVTPTDNKVTYKLEGPYGETTYTAPVNREVWIAWPLKP